MRLIKLFAVRLRGIAECRQRKHAEQQNTFESFGHFFGLSVMEIWKRSISQIDWFNQFLGGFASEVSGHLLLGLPAFAVVW